MSPLTHRLKSFSITLSSTETLEFELNEKVHDRVCWYELKTRVLSGRVDLTDHDYRHEFEFDTAREAEMTMVSIVSQVVRDEYPEEFEN